MPSPGDRRLAASVIVDALQALQPLMDCNRPIELYFEAVEALVWLCSERSDRYFDVLGIHPASARKKIDLAFYCELALEYFEENRSSMKRMYVAMIRYSFESQKKIPYAVLSEFSDDSVQDALDTLTRTRNEKCVGAGKIPAFLDLLSGIAADPPPAAKARRTA